MKKTIFALAALSLFAVASCEKEIDIIPEEKPAETVTGNIIKIEARISDEITKTNYDSEGKFTWAATDEITVIAHADGNTNNQKNFTFTTSAEEITNEGRTATFTGTVEDGYVIDYAAYPASLASNNTNSTYQAPFVKVPSIVSGNTSSAMLIGISDGDGGYKFNTAMSLFRINVSSVPASASKIRLVTSDKQHYPVDGDFTLVEADGVVTLDIDHYHYWSQYPDKGYQSVDISAHGAIDGEDFYFNVPVGTYPARMLSIQILDGSDNIMDEKVIAKALTTERNELLALPALTMDCWEMLGTGKFIDNHLWGKMGFGTNTFEEVGNVNVKFFQNISDPTKYRLENPYGQAASYLAAEGQSQGEHDKYLTFTVPAEGNVTFINHKTGFTLDEQIISILHTDSEKNTVTVGTREEPKIVQLAPIYKGTGDFQESRNGCANKIQIIFPSAVDAYGGSLSITNNKADLSDGLTCAKGASVGTLCLYLSDEPIFSFLDEASSISISSGPGSRKSNPSTSSPQAASSLGWGASGSSYDQTKSGVKYLTWSTWNNNNGDILYQIGCKKFYGLVPSHVTSLIGSYSMNYGSGVTSVPMVFEVSDDPEKGNIMLTYFAGVSGALYGVYKSGISGGNLQFFQSKTTPFASNTYLYSNNSGDLNDLNFAVGYNSSGLANYKNKNWSVISWNAYIKINKNGNATSYSYMRGDKMQEKPKIDLEGKISVNLECCEKDGTYYYEGSSASTALIDNDKSTYWHTPYYSLETLVQYPDYFGHTYTDPYLWSDLDESYGAYIDVDLGEGNEITNFKQRLGFRKSASSSFPKHIRIYASSDKSTWGEPIAEVEDVTLGKNTSGGDWSDFVWCPMSSAKRYIRISIIKNSEDGSLTDASAQKCVHVSELEIYGE